MDVYRGLAHQFCDDSSIAVVLMGSHARGQAERYSDIDLVCVIQGDSAPEAESHYVDDQLVVVSYVTVEQTRAWFTEPRQVVEVMRNLQQAKVLIDRTRFFAKLQERAQQFEWTSDHQYRADEYAANQMVGLIEEVHKGLNGLKQYHVGRLINASHGLAWGLTYAVLAQKGILASGDNGLIADAEQGMGYDSDWSVYHRLVFGITTKAEVVPTLAERTKASLHLYKLTYEAVASACNPTKRHLIETAIHQIDSA